MNVSIDELRSLFLEFLLIFNVHNWLLLGFFPFKAPLIELRHKKLRCLCDEMAVEFSNLDENRVQSSPEIFLLWVTDENPHGHPVSELEVNVFVDRSCRSQEHTGLGRQFRDDLAECVGKKVIDRIMADILEMQRFDFLCRLVFQ